MADTEKITINLSVVDLGRIDLLVEQGFYSTRTDFIRTAIRNQLDSHNREIQETVSRKAMVVGVISYDAGDLEEKRTRNEKLEIRAMGMLILADDVTPELALATISSINIFGVFKAPDEVIDALKREKVLQ
jgi:Arc/MetJ-type ribon-helix-helix transcriptional regulator